MPSACRAKPALLKGFRPFLSTQQEVDATQKILSAACSTTCIYCDIWKLATLIASHVPLSTRYHLLTGTPANSPHSSTPSSPVSPSPISRTTSQSTTYAHVLCASKRIEAQFQTQRSRLSSILSICTVSGADETEGLRMAHDRCSAAVEDLLDQEEELEEALLKDLQEQQYAYEYEYGYAGQYGHSHERRPSMIHVAI
ncbi:uncharacterized protein Z518_03318 [Rhinocladiella mackenziei CBS 650.93]|uniref:Uncharacterized protein n=1 Tax=Rhinocladiella mackenziei CBS 650.93 TaxID=1442369 RepID=A0A0D2IZ35_9EURO|nr:uncharacterized protein Z518_03318 [Rhinocladiella mackenziei CBS 650.93]KIX08661.1 hypothetical protein Z518_03318 [Rhinocladiella mackenziei CBS 650.93]